MSLCQSFLQDARDLYAAGQMDQALLTAQQGVRRFPDSGRLWEMIGMIHWIAGNFKQSLSAFETANSLVALTPSAQCAMADGYVADDKPDIASEIYRHLLASGCLQTALLPNLANGFACTGEMVLALEACREAIRREPHSAANYYTAAFYMGSLAYPDAMIEKEVRTAVRLDPNNVTYRVSLATLLERSGHLEDAHHWIAELQTHQLDEIHCGGCLSKLMSIYSAMSDFDRQAYCQQRLRSFDEGDEPGFDLCDR